MSNAGFRVLVGDVGGTKTVLSLYERRGTLGQERRGWSEIASTTFASAEHPGLESPAQDFLRVAGGERPSIAVFGVAGPVRDQVSRITNLPWILDSRTIAGSLGIARVQLINDFEATARGLLELGPDQCHVLQSGQADPEGLVAVLGAGTGLGQALLSSTDRGLRVFPTEGGHTDFAPRDEIEDGLLRFLRRRHPEHVSVERVVSGPGLVAIYDYVLESALASSPADVLEQIRGGGDAGAIIGELGVRGADPACARALSIFVSIYGAEAGNLALKCLPTGGLFIAGGIAAKILSAMTSGAFLEALLAKGRMRPVLARLPISIVTDPRVGLYGARSLAVALTA